MGHGFANAGGLSAGPALAPDVLMLEAACHQPPSFGLLLGTGLRSPVSLGGTILRLPSERICSSRMSPFVTLCVRAQIFGRLIRYCPSGRQRCNQRGLRRNQAFYGTFKNLSYSSCSKRSCNTFSQDSFHSRRDSEPKA